MDISQEKVQTTNNVPVTVLKLAGDLDGSNFREVIKQAEEICAAGATNILIDLSEMRFMSSAGLATLHRIAVLLRQKDQETQDESWKSLEDLKADTGAPAGPEKHVKLLNPQPRVLKSLEQVDYHRIFEIFTDREAALAAFG